MSKMNGTHLYEVTIPRIQTLTTQILNLHARNISEKVGIGIENLTDELFECLEQEYPYLNPIVQIGGSEHTGLILLKNEINRFLKRELPEYTNNRLLEKLHSALSSDSGSIYTVLINGLHLLFMNTLWEAKISPEILAENIEWVVNDARWRINSRWLYNRNTILAMLEKRDLPSEFLYKMCLYPDAQIAISASRNPGCPEEGQIVGALWELSGSVFDLSR